MSGFFRISRIIIKGYFLFTLGLIPRQLAAALFEKFA